MLNFQLLPRYLLSYHITDCLFIPKQPKSESIDLTTLTQPFTNMVWTCVLATSIMIVLVKLLVWNKNANIIAMIWTIFVSNFGGSFDDHQAKRKSYHLVVFLTLLCGNFIWMGYQASLTVDLSVSEPKLPFNDLERLLHTNWKIFTINKKYIISLHIT